jgi:hypothetical protein
MLVQLPPDQISKHWEIIRYSIEQAFPPSTAAIDMTAILTHALGGNLHVWAGLDNESGTIIAIMTTTIVSDIGSHAPDLLLYSMYGIGDSIKRDNWLDGFETLKKFATSKGCKRLTAFTASDAIKKLVKWFGGDVSNTYIAIAV